MAHVTDLGFTADELIAAVEAGDVRSQTHPDNAVLRIYNYTEDVQYRNRWNKITLACRGLILDTATWEVVARPWDKFFNLGQMDNRIAWNAPVEVTDKMDGSLGILYPVPHEPGEWAIATRGSFASEQAVHATELLNSVYGDVKGSNFNFFYDWTFLFEIIYPDNRIVCNYGDTDDLVLLGAVHIENGHYIGPGEARGILGWSGPVTTVFDYQTFADAVSAPDRKGAEGYVIRSGRNIVKLKQQDYLELHRIVTNLSPKTIWEALGSGRDADDICRDIPDEFHNYVQEIATGLLDEAVSIYYNALLNHANALRLTMLSGEYSRKRFAEHAKKSDNPGLVFSLEDGKPIDDTVWKMVKPRGDIKTLVRDEG